MDPATKPERTSTSEDVLDPVDLDDGPPFDADLSAILDFVGVIEDAARGIRAAAER